MATPGGSFVARGCPENEYSDFMAQYMDASLAAGVAQTHIGACPATCGACGVAGRRLNAGASSREQSSGDASWHHLNVSLLHDASPHMRKSLGKGFKSQAACPGGSMPLSEHLVAHRWWKSSLVDAYQDSALFNVVCEEAIEVSFFARVSYIWPMLNILQVIVLTYGVKFIYVFFVHACSGAADNDDMASDDIASDDMASDDMATDPSPANPSMLEAHADLDSATVASWKHKAFSVVEDPIDARLRLDHSKARADVQPV